jgi:predicted GIY-YIG superfamily endonuclease
MIVIASEAKQSRIICAAVPDSGLFRPPAGPRANSRRNVVKQPCVYIMANKRNGTLYAGVTANLPGRAFQHREGLVKGFTKKYGCKMLVWFEPHENMYAAIVREKQIKAGNRAKKLALIEALNPHWRDLYENLT